VFWSSREVEQEATQYKRCWEVESGGASGHAMAKNSEVGEMIGAGNPRQLCGVSSRRKATNSVAICRKEAGTVT
jgi:hypothetical protein